MTAQTSNAELKGFPDGRSANFYDGCVGHPVVVGSTYESTPWQAVQVAVWEALGRHPAS
jgi:hypothetical protein